MTPMRSVLLTVLVGLCGAIAPAAAAAEPLFDGDMGFQAIQGPEGPEESSWEVHLSEGQDLREVDDRHAAVYYTDADRRAFGIEAELAHDASGTDVPTTLSVTQPNVITLTVHHRDGNPVAGGAPFDYPVTAGTGWEGGFQSVEIEGPPDEYQLAHPPSREIPEIPEAPPSRCIVPDLTGRTLRASRKMLRRAHCTLGQVRGERSRGARVLTQYRQVGKVLPVWTAVDVKALKAVQGIPAID
jgi:hypothetical protein